MAPDEMVWALSRHTAAKHAILRAYLGAWFPILGSWNGKIVFIDGFAGPGEYKDGEPGSPLIAIQAARDQRLDLSRTQIGFMFIEADRRRARNLRGLLEAMEAAEEVPAHLAWDVRTGEFAETVIPLLDATEGVGMAPAFVMIDPFGAKGVPYSLIRRLGSKPRCDVLVSFMYEPISRFLRTKEFEPHLDELFGLPDWRAADGLETTRKRAYLHDLYRDQLTAAGWTHVRSFELWDAQNKLEYVLFFGTHHEKGLEVIKDAMWKVDPSGTYRFSDATNEAQRTMFGEPDYAFLSASVVSRFSGAANVSIEELEQFVLVDTAFRPEHLRKNVLVPLETTQALEVVTPRKRARTYPKGTMMRFV